MTDLPAVRPKRVGHTWFLQRPKICLKPNASPRGINNHHLRMANTIIVRPEKSVEHSTIATTLARFNPVAALWFGEVRAADNVLQNATVLFDHSKSGTRLPVASSSLTRYR